jgi:hypothetical protein
MKKSSLGPENRALFDAARRGFAPTGEDRARVAKALGVTVGVGGGIAAATAKGAAGKVATSTTVAGLSSGGVLAAKWVAIVGVVAAVGAGGVALYRGDAARVRSQTAAAHVGAASTSEPTLPSGVGRTERAQLFEKEQAPEPAQRGLPSASLPVSGPLGVLPDSNEAKSGSPASTPSTPAGGPVGSPEPAAVALAHRAATSLSSATTQPYAAPPAPSAASSSGPTGAAAAASAPEPSPPAETPAPIVRVADEAHLLREADAALRAGDTAGATRWLDEHARLFPRGVLVEERDVQRVSVLCAAGQTDAARVEARRFLTSYPQSFLAGRVRASCGAR